MLFFCRVLDLLVDTHDPHVMQSEPYPVTLSLCPLLKFHWRDVTLFFLSDRMLCTRRHSALVGNIYIYEIIITVIIHIYHKIFITFPDKMVHYTARLPWYMVHIASCRTPTSIIRTEVHVPMSAIPHVIQLWVSRSTAVQQYTYTPSVRADIVNIAQFLGVESQPARAFIPVLCDAMDTGQWPLTAFGNVTWGLQTSNGLKYIPGTWYQVPGITLLLNTHILYQGICISS